MKQVVIFVGKFQPPHAGHVSACRLLQERFSDADVHIEATVKMDGKDRPFSWDDKKAIFDLVSLGDIVYSVVTPYQYTEAERILNLNLNETVLIYAVGKKDMQEERRFSFEPKKNGDPSYLQPYPNDGNFFPGSDHGHVFEVPEFTFQIEMPNGKYCELSSSTEVRTLFRNSSHEEQKSIIHSLYGKYDPYIHQIMRDRLQ